MLSLVPRNCKFYCIVCSVSVCVCVYCAHVTSSSDDLADLEYPLARGRVCFCRSCGTEAQLLKHDNKMQSMKLTVASSEKIPPTTTAASLSLFLLHFYPRVTVGPIFLLCLWYHSERKERHHRSTVRTYIYTRLWEITNSLYFFHLVVLLLGCVKINNTFNTRRSRGTWAEPQST